MTFSKSFFSFFYIEKNPIAHEQLKILQCNVVVVVF